MIRRCRGSGGVSLPVARAQRLLRVPPAGTDDEVLFLATHAEHLLLSSLPLPRSVCPSSSLSRFLSLPFSLPPSLSKESGVVAVIWFLCDVSKLEHVM